MKHIYYMIIFFNFLSSFTYAIQEKKVIDKGICFYFTGLSGAGKSTLAEKFKEKLIALNYSENNITILDGDEIRKNLSFGLNFSKKHRSLNVRRIGYVASLIVKHKGICLVANIAPYEEDRIYNRDVISKYGDYIEVFVNTSLEVCEKRDVKGLYEKARKGQIKQFTGIDDPYEEPEKAEISVDGSKNIKTCIEKLMKYIK